MTSVDMIKTIEQIQHTQNNIKIFTAVPMGVLMIMYFFSFAALIDHGQMGMLGVEIGTTILFIFTFIYLNPITFYVVKRWYKKSQAHSKIISKLTPLTINKSADVLYEEILH